jgi:hypothetical protein
MLREYPRVQGMSDGPPTLLYSPDLCLGSGLYLLIL